jgi:hypothetical protein
MRETNPLSIARITLSNGRARVLNVDSKTALHFETATADLPLLGGIVFQRGCKVDIVLADVATGLKQRGARLAGVIQKIGPEPGCDIEGSRLQSLSGDWSLPLLENRGPQARGCRLDYSSIAEASVRILASLPDDADFMMLNRFGRAEAEGAGLREILETCLHRQICVLVAVREDYLPAWNEYHGGLGTTLPADADVILDWCDARPREPQSSENKRT